MFYFIAYSRMIVLLKTVNRTDYHYLLRVVKAEYYPLACDAFDRQFGLVSFVNSYKR